MQTLAPSADALARFTLHRWRHLQSQRRTLAEKQRIVDLNVKLGRNQWENQQVIDLYMDWLRRAEYSVFLQAKELGIALETSGEARGS
jgi:hypothetical protein